MTKAIALNDVEKRTVAHYVEAFRAYMATDRFQKDNADRRERVSFFQRELPGRLDTFSEADVETIIKQLWASRIWGNKDYLTQKIIESNGIDALKEQIAGLFATDDPEKTYAEFLKEVNGLGPASTTEILTYLYPERCGIWNRQAREGLKLLGLTNHVSPDKYRLSVGEYRTFNRLLGAIAGELKSAGIGDDIDLLFVDFFLYEVAQAPKPVTPGDGTKKVVKPLPSADFDHNEIRDLLADIGISLGFAVDTEVRIAHGAQVDVVWRARIANLGLVTYVFEVHRAGSIDSLILNLQKARSASSVQKVVAVSDQAQLDTIRKECEGLPEEFRRVLRLWEVSDVLETGEHLQRVMTSISNLDLIEGTVA